MTFNETFTVKAAAPFNFDLSAQIFRNGDREIRTYQEGVFTIVLKLSNQLVLVKVASAGTVEKPVIRINLAANKPITAEDKQITAEKIKFFFNFDFELNAFYREVKDDPVMSQIASQLYGLKNPTTPTVFESLVDSIVEQQISIKVAIALEQKLVKKFGDRLKIERTDYFVFPTPQNLAQAQP